jgi:hypothetical protein
MSCCGKKREAMQKQQTIFQPPIAPIVAARSRIPVVFQGKGAYLVAGTHSHEVYEFPAERPEQLVDAKDASDLIRSGLFRIRA